MPGPSLQCGEGGGGAGTEVRRVEEEREINLNVMKVGRKKGENAKTMTRQRDVTGFVQSHHARGCGGHLRHHHAIAELLTATHLHDRERSAAIQATKKSGDFRTQRFIQQIQH